MSVPSHSGLYKSCLLLQANTLSYTWTDTGLVPFKNTESGPLQLYYRVRPIDCTCTSCILNFDQVRVYLSEKYPDVANIQQVDQTCLLDISPPLPSVVVNLTASVEDIVWQNLGAVITGVAVQWSLPLNTTISTDPTTLKYQYDIGDNTSTHSDPQEFGTVNQVIKPRFTV